MEALRGLATPRVHTAFLARLDSRVCHTSVKSQPLSMSAALSYPPSLSYGQYAETMEPLPAVMTSAIGTSERGLGRRAARGTDINVHGRQTGAKDADDGMVGTTKMSCSQMIMWVDR